MKKGQIDFRINLYNYEELDSTNNYIHDIPIPEDIDIIAVRTEYQTAGKGQGTNKWESESGKNLLFSIKFKPYSIKACDQFLLLQAVSMGIRNLISDILLDGCSIKWPNDIYYKDKKISGTLSECTLKNGMVDEFIAGIGINVNQLEFTSDAPNPISIANVLGDELDRMEFFNKTLKYICDEIAILNHGDYHRMREYYNAFLYRHHGIYTYEDKDGRFEATFENILPNGHLVLKRTDGTLSEYEFKEVKYII